MVYLHPNREFRGYYGCGPEMLARLVKERHILLLWGEPGQYKNSKYRVSFVEFFYWFKQLKLDEDESYGPFYSNRIEESLARQYFNGRSWSEIVEEERKPFEGKTFKPVSYGGGLEANPASFLPERIAWMKLLGSPFDLLGETIKKSAEADPSLSLAVEVAFVLHELFTAPIFYARGCLHSIDYKEDYSKSYKSTIRFLTGYTNQYKPGIKEIPHELALGLGTLWHIITHWRFYTRPECERPQAYPTIRAVPEDKLRCVVEEEELRKLALLSQQHRNMTLECGNAGLSGDEEHSKGTAKIIYQKRADIAKWHRENEIETRVNATELIKNTLPLIAGVYIGIKGIRLEGLPEFDHLLVSAARDLREPLDQAWDMNVPLRIRREVEEKLRPLDYLPPLCVWRVPAEEARNHTRD